MFYICREKFSAMIQIANPIYDSVFKYMMQNNKVCMILLSALLNRDIVEVELKNNELIRADLKKFAVLRLDFLAKIKNPDGTFEMVSIELQKAEKSTEIVRFRRYLAKFAMGLSRKDISEKINISLEQLNKLLD
ncbi:MAG: hypothetical protein K5685_15930 [Bacteroidales bacterium]|nr:hypothetical protein [Bacteroidales bacterium]